VGSALDVTPKALRKPSVILIVDGVAVVQLLHAPETELIRIPPEGSTAIADRPGAMELMTATLVWPAVIWLPVEERPALREVSVVPATATRTPLTLIDPPALPAGTLITSTPELLLEAGLFTEGSVPAA